MGAYSEIPKHKVDELDKWADKAHKLHISYGELQSQETSELLRHDANYRKLIAIQMCK